jgi:hypothetical protein
MLQLPKLTRDGGVVLLVCGHTHVLLDDGPTEVVLQVELVLHVPGHRSHTGVEVRTLEVGHSLKVLLPYGIPLITNQEERVWHLCGSGEATLPQGGECDLCCLLDGVI